MRERVRVGMREREREICREKESERERDGPQSCIHKNNFSR